MKFSKTILRNFKLSHFRNNRKLNLVFHIDHSQGDMELNFVVGLMGHNMKLNYFIGWMDYDESSHWLLCNKRFSI